MLTSSISDLPIESFQSIDSFYTDYPVALEPALEPEFSPLSFDGEAIQLENLNARMKMILKLKLREFIHLSPFFQDIPAIDVTLYPVVPRARGFMVAVQDDCPRRVPGFSPRRRASRHVAV